MVVERAAEAHQFNLGITEEPGHVLPLRLGQRDLNTVGVGSAQLDSFKLCRFAILDDRRDIPILGQVVSNASEADLRWFGEGSGRLAGGKGVLARESKRTQSEARDFEETAAIGF